MAMRKEYMRLAKMVIDENIIGYISTLQWPKRNGIYLIERTSRERLSWQTGRPGRRWVQEFL
jgi:hypothetical protein